MFSAALTLCLLTSAAASSCTSESVICVKDVSSQRADELCSAFSDCAYATAQAPCQDRDSRCDWSVPLYLFLNWRVLSSSLRPTAEVIEQLDMLASNLDGPISDGVCSDGEYPHLTATYSSTRRRRPGLDLVMAVTPECPFFPLDVDASRSLDGVIRRSDLSLQTMATA